MTKYEALKLALEALEEGNFVYPTALRTAIIEALAQPEQPAPSVGAEVISAQDAVYHVCLEKWGAKNGVTIDAMSVLNFLKAQPEQEPVGTLNISRFKGHLVNHDFDYFGDLPDGTYSIYTAPPKREPAEFVAVPRTDEDVKTFGFMGKEQPEQEPFNPDWVSYRQGKLDGAAESLEETKRKEWVGLTGGDMDDITSTAMDKADAMLLTEAKLKEKNHG